MGLTDANVRALKGKARPYKITDGEGLYVLIKPNGSRLWALAYRYFGKQKTLAFGKYPAVSLLAARRARDDAKRLLAAGTDPSAHRKGERKSRASAVASTFEAVANEWFENNRSRWVATYSSRLKSRLDEDLLPAIGKRPIADIEPIEILDAVRKIKKRAP